MKNRLVKSAMSDSLGDGAGNPTVDQAQLYRRWASGGAAVAIVGEVQTDPSALEKPGNIVLTDDFHAPAFMNLTKAARDHDAHIWAQLGHAGALAYPPLGRPVGPSAIRMPELACEEMSVAEIEAMPRLFALGAARAKAAGFTGVQVHGAHGFLLSQFLSPLFNRRGDSWGGSLPNRARLLLETIDAVRSAVGSHFPVALKMNSSDRIQGGFEEGDARELVSLLDDTSVDLIEISGGTYFPGAKSAGGGRSGEPYFRDFAETLRSRTAKPIMLTGGFRTRRQASDALAAGASDCIGLARALVLDTELPVNWFKSDGTDPEFPQLSSTKPGAVTAWYTMRLARLARGLDEGQDMDADAALEHYERRDRERHAAWRQRFGTSG